MIFSGGSGDFFTNIAPRRCVLCCSVDWQCSAGIFCCLSSVRPQRWTGVRASLTYIWRHIHVFSRVSVWMHFNRSLFLTFKRTPTEFFIILKLKEVEILLQKKRLHELKDLLPLTLLPGFTLLLFLAGWSYLCVWSTLITWNKATKEQWCSWCFVCLSYRCSCWSVESTRLQVCCPIVDLCVTDKLFTAKGDKRLSQGCFLRKTEEHTDTEADVFRYVLDCVPLWSLSAIYSCSLLHHYENSNER